MAHRQRSREQWRELVEGWPGSGLTQADYCERHSIAVASLHRWREILRRAPEDSRPAPNAGRAHDAVRLLPVELPVEFRARARDTAPALRLVFADALRLEIAPGFDEATLRRLIGLLREALAS
jgi:hypothetical protein